MLYRKIIAVCSQFHTKHINTLCGQNVQLLTFETRGLWSNHETSLLHWFLLGKSCSANPTLDVSGRLDTDLCFHLATRAGNCDARGRSSSKVY